MMKWLAPLLGAGIGAFAGSSLFGGGTMGLLIGGALGALGGILVNGWVGGDEKPSGTHAGAPGSPARNPKLEADIEQQSKDRQKLEEARALATLKNYKPSSREEPGRSELGGILPLPVPPKDENQKPSGGFTMGQ